MQVIKTIAEFRALRVELSRKSFTVALVPTMGALHTGHLSLISKAREIADMVVVSVFVNPTQFGPSEDLGRYPRPLEKDLALLEQERVNILFLPEAGEMYPPSYRTYVTVEELGQKYCGQFRPGHFRGVATVVLKLLNIVQPTVAVFGQKDAQQCVIVQRLVEDLNLDAQIVVCPTVREPDGLAASSRNEYLSAEHRRAAAVLHRSLLRAEEGVRSGERLSANILEGVRELILGEPLVRLQYAEIVDPQDLSLMAILDRDALLLLAALVGNTRLIDNTLLRP